MRQIEILLNKIHMESVAEHGRLVDAMNSVLQCAGSSGIRADHFFERSIRLAKSNRDPRLLRVQCGVTADQLVRRVAGREAGIRVVN